MSSPQWETVSLQTTNQNEPSHPFKLLLVRPLIIQKTGTRSGVVAVTDPAMPLVDLWNVFTGGIQKSLEMQKCCEQSLWEITVKVQKLKTAIETRQLVG